MLTMGKMDQDVRLLHRHSRLGCVGELGYTTSDWMLGQDVPVAGSGREHCIRWLQDRDRLDRRGVGRHVAEIGGE